MKVAIASDHAGYLLKEEIKKHLQNNYDVIDFGTNSTESVDYPDFAKQVAKYVQNNDSLGILVCYTGVGMSITANKYHGVRAALVFNEANAMLAREHNNANIICLGSKDVTVSNAIKYVDIFLTTAFAGRRHARRVNKIHECEIDGEQ